MPIITNCSGTFTLNKSEPIHRWYSYIEGYSSKLVEKEFDQLSKFKLHAVYDPFGGTGTTLLSSSVRGLVSYYSETNPFMRDVIDVKTNSIRSLLKKDPSLESLRTLYNRITQTELVPTVFTDEYTGFEKYYNPVVLQEILWLQKIVDEITESNSRKIAMLALSSILVDSSKMIRRGDLRYARPNEKGIISARMKFQEKLSTIIEDIINHGNDVRCETIALAPDAREVTENDIVDCIITSPPYLNGTNYIRNTKLELKLNGYVKQESDLALFHSRGVIAGINNVSKRNTAEQTLPEVIPYIEALTPLAYDKRIPLMVNGYFNDMNKVFHKLRNILMNNGFFIMDIGDSQFAGVHIPTHTILTSLCNNHGFRLYDDEILRKRRSKNGMELTQRLLRFRLEK